VGKETALPSRLDGDTVKKTPKILVAKPKTIKWKIKRGAADPNYGSKIDSKIGKMIPLEQIPFMGVAEMRMRNGYYITEHGATSNDQRVNVIICGFNRGVVLLGFDQATDTAYMDTYGSYLNGATNLVDLSIKDLIAEKYVWFGHPGVSLRYLGQYPKFEIKPYERSPFILASEVRAGDTICLIHKGKQSYINVAEIEEGEVGDDAAICLRGEGHSPCSSGIIVFDKFNVKADTRVVLVDRTGE
jgi:hypothetical protein